MDMNSFICIGTATLASLMKTPITSCYCGVLNPHVLSQCGSTVIESYTPVAMFTFILRV